MNQYVIKFSKQGFICYTSHLDMLRLFKRAFKKAGIRLSYSQGFNPHPKMGFAQPLSLGYSSVAEYLEFETEEAYEPDQLKTAIEEQMPQGVMIFSCQETGDQKKSMAARTKAAEYLIGIPVGKALRKAPEKLCQEFLAENEIMVPKKQKKSKAFKDVNIRDKIQSLNVVAEGDNLIFTALLDSGSESNLSPELLITALTKFMGIDTQRAEMSVMRAKLIFEKKVK